MSRYKTLIVFVIVLALLFAGYQFLWPSVNPSATTLSGSTQENQAEVIGNQILATLAQLKTIRLDDSVLRDPLFVSLRDLSPALVPQPVGRNNPFAPLGTGGSPARSTD